MEFLSDANSPAAADVIAFVRYDIEYASGQSSPIFSEAVDKYPQLRRPICQKLLEAFGSIKSGKVFRGALWIVGEYFTDLSGQTIKFASHAHADSLVRYRANFS